MTRRDPGTTTGRRTDQSPVGSSSEDLLIRLEWARDLVAAALSEVSATAARERHPNPSD
ncbi:hypothetical protein C8250_001135 [Streptomyces sp. So13.3]|uniref:hypothetical protein n=1 Tax=Streptomyces TaxID=1883 RepID=UPI00164D069E|nr:MULTISPECIES: hypothetical protein [Streptomyces]MCZ4096883.1 hypothetical protein [Streptomyces sp. H39-C1]QNA70731.1 hypothetical protein C8250_001135 [Streptomyces sp. So13.3]